jgi:YkoY family integral membrane protein
MIANLIIILNLFILESLLSVDNAAVLAIMVKDLPKDQQPKALKYGLIGAFVFRGLALLLATYIIKFSFLKILGGLYLCYLCYAFFTPEKDSLEEGINKDSNKLFSFFKNKIGLFWSTVILVEAIDLAFSIDNVFAAAAMTNNIVLIMIGVGIGIISMRFIAQWFVTLIHKHPTLETSAFIVIGLLGLKLIIPTIFSIEVSHAVNMVFSFIMMAIFFIPLINFKSLK